MLSFFNQPERINAIADSISGFVWRLQDENGNATNINAFDDECLRFCNNMYHIKNTIYARGN